MLAERVKRVVGIVVGEVQNAFIKGRFILYGVLIANKTMEYLRKKKRRSLIFKVDFEKAYDSLNWRFLRDIMKKMRFEDKWCKWVDSCLRSSSMSILVNGSPSEEFGLERGVRQAVEKGIFRGMTVGANNVTVSHLQYADDTIFFGDWSKENTKSLMCILKCFEEVSGLRVKYNKSKIYGIGVSEGDLTDIKMDGVLYWRVNGGEGLGRMGSLWVRVVKSIHEACMGLGDIGEDIDGLGVDFTSSCVGVMGDGRDIRIKEVNVMDRGFWDDSRWVWEWDWVRDIRGRVCKELEDLLGALQHVVVSNNCRDRWRWSLDEDGKFTVKELSRLIEEKIILSDNRDQETPWNKLVPKKVNIFVWRALRRRLPVRVELDKRGIDLDSVLCPCCNNIVETGAHSLITCDLAMSVWDKIFDWWKVRSVNAFTIDEFFSSNRNLNVPNYFSRVWQVVIWSIGYYIWKERNSRVFGNKLGIEIYHIKINLTAPTLNFPGIEEYNPYSIGLIYLNNKEEKRVMDLVDILKFCDVTLEKVLKEVKLKIFETQFKMKTPLLGDLDLKIMKAYEKEIKNRLKHRWQMIICESFVNGRPILQSMAR
ncbi:reverse transcriptase domain, reverse transcriptase zinc-binding domain protein [Tanacetum coccineum]